MKRLLALMLAIAATAPVALAQPQTEPRLAGGPERICTEAEIRQALAGSYTGPPCRFTEMPAGLDAAPRRPVAQQAATQPPIVQPVHTPQPVPVQQATRSQPVPARPMRQPGLAIQHAVVTARHEGNAFIASQHASSLRAQTVGRAQMTDRQWPPRQSDRAVIAPSLRPEIRSSETVRLGDDFFSGNLVGGVERPFMPVYSYRGLILIAADGQARTGHAGPGHRIRQVRALDHRNAPLPHAAPRRAYPYP